MFEVAESGEVGKLRGVVFEAQHAAAIQQLVLRFHDGRQVACRDGAVVTDRVARESLGIRRRQAAQVLDQELECRRVYFDLTPVITQILRRAALDDRAPFARPGQAQRETGSEPRQLVRYLETMSDQEQRELGGVRRQRDVLE